MTSILFPKSTNKFGRCSRKNLKNQAKIDSVREAFLERVKRAISDGGYEEYEVCNCDQSRFDKELHSHRTHAFRGQHHVTVEVGSISATTHSYMVMPIISMAGIVSKRLYLKSQEPKGQWPQIKTPKFPPNIVAYPGTTAMMTNEDLEIFLEQLFIKQVINFGLKKCLLMCDSWSSNKNDALFKLPEIGVTNLVINK